MPHLRIDHPDKSTPYTHLNRDYLPKKMDIPHKRIGPKTFKAAKIGSHILRSANKVAVPVAVGIDSYNLYAAVTQDLQETGGIGKRTAVEGASTVGGWAGALGGGAVGAKAGTTIGCIFGKGKQFFVLLKFS